MIGLNTEELRELLELLHDRFNREEFIEADPISVPHRFSRREDIEIAGFMAAAIAWGNRKAIVKSANRMMEFMDNDPYNYVCNASIDELSTLQKYVHRTFNGQDFIDFIMAIQGVCQRHGSIGELFESLYIEHGAIEKVLSEFRSEFFACEHHEHCHKHISSIDKGAACKRLNMYLRWMVRHDNRGVDFGLWQHIPASALYLPLDVHSGNVARELGLLTRRQSDWKAVTEVTKALRVFDESDPVKYDFALFGAGIESVIKRTVE